MRLFNIFLSLSTVLLFFSLCLPQPVAAATIRMGENVFLSEDSKNLSDLYLFGSDIKVDAAVTNDVVAGGGDITINNSVTGSVMAVGGNISVLGPVGNTIRIGGGDILIDGPVTRDVVIGGGSVTITKNASISGDLLFAGGKLTLSGPVRGKVLIQGGEVTINSTVSGNVEGEVGSLTLGKSAVITGDLRYSSEKKASIADTAIVRGENSFKKIERSEDTGRDIGRLVSAGTYYKLVTDILFSLLFVLLVPLFLKDTISSMKKSPLRHGVSGFIALFSIPLVSLFLLLIFWVGVFSFLMYFILIVLSMVVANVFVGDYLISWYYKRSNKKYLLDWKAAIVGPVVLFILWLIPLFGWLVAFVIYLLALGGLLNQLYTFSLTQKQKDISGEK